MVDERGSQSIRDGGPLAAAMARREDANGRELQPEEVEAAEKRFGDAMRASREFYKKQKIEVEEKIRELDSQLKAINAFVYEGANTYPIPLAEGEAPKSKDELARIARDIGGELRELKKRLDKE